MKPEAPVTKQFISGETQGRFCDNTMPEAIKSFSHSAA
jgi:hypothetical protein